MTNFPEMLFSKYFSWVAYFSFILEQNECVIKSTSSISRKYSYLKLGLFLDTPRKRVDIGWQQYDQHRILCCFAYGRLSQCSHRPSELPTRPTESGILCCWSLHHSASLASINSQSFLPVLLSYSYFFISIFPMTINPNTMKTSKSICALMIAIFH